MISLRADIPLKISNARSIGHNKSYSNVPMKTYSAHYYVMFSIFTEINQAWTIFFFFLKSWLSLYTLPNRELQTVHISVWERFGWRGILTRVSPWATVPRHAKFNHQKSDVILNSWSYPNDSHQGFYLFFFFFTNIWQMPDLSPFEINN